MKTSIVLSVAEYTVRLAKSRTDHSATTFMFIIMIMILSNLEFVALVFLCLSLT